MQQRFLGATGLSVSRLGLGTMTWGRDTDEHEAREQLVAFVEAGGTLRRHRRGLHRRRLRAADRLPPRRRLRARRDRAGHQGRHRQRRKGERFTNASRGHLVSSPRRVARAARRRPRRPVAGAHLGRRRAARGDADRPRLRRDDRAGGVRRGEQLQRLAVRAGRHLAAGGARAGRRWPPTRSSTPCSTAPSRRETSRPPRRSASACCPGRRSAVACSPASTAAARPPTPARRRPHFSTFVGRYLDDFSPARRRGRGPGCRRPGLVARSRWPWPGCATGPGSPRRSSARARPPSCASRSPSRSASSPPRSSRRSTTCPPTAGGDCD